MEGNMSFDGFPEDSLQFLADLARHNDQRWYQANKKRMAASLIDPARAFVLAMGKQLESVVPGIRYEPKTNGSIARLARDTRFSKDKRPYKEHLILRFWTGESPKGGPAFWFRFHPEFVGIGAGIHMFDGDELKSYRKRVDVDKTGRDLQKQLASLERKGYDKMGDEYKRVPRGFDPDHPRGDLLRLKGLFAFVESDVPAEFTSRRFVTYCMKRCRVLAPLHRWLDQI